MILSSMQQELNFYYTPDGKKQLKKSQKPMTIHVVDLIVKYALKVDVSDIHIEPHDEYMLVRFRVDGVLYDVLKIDDLDVRGSLCSSIRAQAAMHGDGTAKKKAQDGRWSIDVTGQRVDFRISVFPLVFGEKIVMRIFRQNKTAYIVENIGMTHEDSDQLKSFLMNKTGVLFVTGPTGSGKTSTLYAALNHITKPDINIVTLEDPVEYKFDRINQSQIDTTLGFDFSDGLRAVLRQDPDVIFVGEIRDVETSEIAVRASMTGHLVLTTIHTNDAATAITRLIDMGIEPFLLAGTASLIVNQRLLRRVCPLCKKSVSLPQILPKELECIRAENILVYEASGCDMCNETGYQGRVAVFELLRTNEKINRLILEKASAAEIRKQAIQNGMKTLTQDAVRLLKEEKTTLSEVIKIVAM